MGASEQHGREFHAGRPRWICRVGDGVLKRVGWEGRENVDAARLRSDLRAGARSQQIAQKESTRPTQSTYYDRLYQSDFEIERPRGAGRLYEYLLRFKFRRGMEMLGEPVAGRSVLCVCAGAGMDMEFLSEAGASVVGLDLSHGAMLAARERARRHGFTARFVVGDAEQLPFSDGSFDYCYVHDGLHHLDDPDRALRELARLARRGVIISEPADARLTKLAIQLGVIRAHEEAGNYVARFTPGALSATFAAAGFPRVRSCRYFMKYPHVPNRLFLVFSHPLLFPIARLAFLILGDRILARLGNKLSFAARRAENPTVLCVGRLPDAQHDPKAGHTPG